MKEDIRKLLINLLYDLFNKHFIRVYIEMFLYSLLMVWILYKLSLWKFNYTKDTLLWILFSALYLSFKVADDKGNRKLFVNIIKDAINVTMVIEFLLNIYTFPIIIEVLVIVIIILLGLMIAFIEIHPDKDKYSQVHRLMTGINMYMGLNIIIFLIFEVLKSFKNLITLDNFQSFVLPIILTIMFIPYLFYLLMRISYDQLSIPIKLNKVSSEWIIFYFKVMVYKYCKFDRKKIVDLKRTKNHLIINMKTKEDVDNIFMMV